MRECWKCCASIGDDERVCPQCGAASPGSTESFEPVEIGDEVAETAGSAEGPLLIVRKGPQCGDRFFIDRPRLTIGRDPKSDIFLNDMTVSRNHAELLMDERGVGVTDAGSLNGTYLNGSCVDRARLRDGDVLQIGTFQMVYQTGGDFS